MMKKSSVSILLLIPLLFSGCQKQKETKSQIMINDFESIEQLTLMKFPSPNHNNRGRMELSEEHVTSGKKSLKYYNDFGSYIEMCHYFDHIVDDEIDVSNMKTISLDIYNDSDFDTSGTLYLYASDDLTSVLNYDFVLTKKEMNHIDFSLSKVAIEYNAENLRAVSLKLFTPNTDYDKNIFYTFYLDNWIATMGSEYTEEDQKYNSIIGNIKDKIEQLPTGSAIQDSTSDALQEISDLIDSLPDLYRGSIPNLATFKDAVSSYNDYLVEHRAVDYDRNAFLNLDEFYGIAQLKPDNGVKLEVLYSHDKWEGNNSEGSTKVIFQGSTTNRVVYSSNVDLTKFDFTYITVHNASKNYVRIWLSYNNNLFMDIAPNKTQTSSFVASQLAGQDFWNIDHLNYTTGSPGALIPSSGVIYFGYSYVIGRSQKTLLSHLNHAFSTMPEVASLNNEDDYLKGLTSVHTAKKLYDQIEDKTQIDQDKLDLLETLEDKYQTDGYQMSCSAYEAAIQRFSYGQEFAAQIGIIDNDYGFVTAANITENCLNGDKTAIEQGFNYDGNIDFLKQMNGFVFYIYSPLSKPINLSVRTSNWDNWTKYYINKTIYSGWNKIEVPAIIVSDSLVNEYKFAIMVSDSPSGDLTGEWKFSSLFGIPRVIE